MRVLVAIDHPATAEEIITFAKEKHWLENADVRAVYVMAPIMMTDAMAPIPTQAVQVMYDNAAAIMKEAAKKLELEIGRKPDISIPFGDPAHVLVEEAKEWKADLVVLSSHTLPRWERLLTGSVSKFVAEHVDCPVLVLRDGSQTEPETDPIPKAMMYCAQCAQSFLQPKRAPLLRCPYCANSDIATLRIIYREDDPDTTDMLTSADFQAGD